MSRIMRNGVERDTGAIMRVDSELLGPSRAMAGRGDRLRHVAAPHPALLRGLPSLLDERGEVTRRRRLQDFEDHDVLVAEHDELRAGFEPEAHPDLFGDDDLALGRQGGGGGFTHGGTSESLTGKIAPDGVRRKWARDSVKSNTLEGFGSRLTALRQSQGMTRTELGHAAGIS